MSAIIVCDKCDTRLDSPELEAKERHIRATLTYVQLGASDVVVERDLCEGCAEETRREFEARPFIDSRSPAPAGASGNRRREDNDNRQEAS